MGKHWYFGCECSKMAKDTGEEIIGNHNIKCFHCGNVGKVDELYNHIEYNEFCVDGYDGILGNDWNATHYYLIRCNVCKEISLCKFTTNGNQEISYEQYIHECEFLYTGTVYDETLRLKKCNFEIIYPSYNKSSIIDDKTLNEKYPDAMEIYKQAQIAESLQLKLICGMAYRKALEFFIKQYLINKNPLQTDEIKKKYLQNCINDYIKDENIKECAKRAAWLGNDETHYIKKWEEKDVNDLKLLLELIISWIKTDELAKKFKMDMP